MPGQKNVQFTLWASATLVPVQIFVLCADYWHVRGRGIDWDSVQGLIIVNTRKGNYELTL